MSDAMPITASSAGAGDFAVPEAKFANAPTPAATTDRKPRIEADCGRCSLNLPVAGTQFILAHPAVSTRGSFRRISNGYRRNPSDFRQLLKAEAIMPTGAPVGNQLSPGRPRSSTDHDK